jgi:hypothetical protein
MVEASKIDHRLITPYHPRANGVAERTVQTATRAIKKLLKGVKHNWDAYVPFVQFCINQKVSERHKHRPFTVIFGRQANAFADFSDAPAAPDSALPSIEHKKFIEEVQTHVDAMQQTLFPEVAANNQTTSARATGKYNKAHRTVDIPLESFVMVRDKARKSKLDHTNEGPYKVVNKTQGGSYVLQDLAGQLLPHNFPPSALISLSTNPTFTQESYEVDAILDHRDTPQGYEYLVRWKNYTSEDDTWESEDNFDDLGAAHEYWSRRGLPAPLAQTGGE